MAFTKRWTDNCAGWVPPISQMYISLLIYVQIIRAMDSSNVLPPGSPLANFYSTFLSMYPLSELWIPGPLVSFFRSLSAFWPSADDQFGNVSPSLPNTPGWTVANIFRLAAHNGTDQVNYLLPNISVFISRLRTITTTALEANMTQGTFSTHVEGPNHLSSLFGRTLTDDANEHHILISPGAAFAYPDNLGLWINASSSLGRLSIPNDLVATAGANQTAPIDQWTAFFRLSQNANEHSWIGPVSAVMAKYSQFYNGSTSLEDIVPNCSAAPAVKSRFTALSTIYTLPAFTARAGTGASRSHGNANCEAHATLRNNARVVMDHRVALKGIPDAHCYAASTYGINAYTSQAAQNSFRTGTFWSLGPDVLGRSNVEVLPGVQATIVREYHSDTRIPATKQ